MENNNVEVLQQAERIKLEEIIKSYFGDHLISVDIQFEKLISEVTIQYEDFLGLSKVYSYFTTILTTCRCLTINRRLSYEGFKKVLDSLDNRYKIYYYEGSEDALLHTSIKDLIDANMDDESVL